MALNGSIEEAGLPNVLQLLALGGKTGCIAVERATVHGAIYLDRGMVIWAEIVSSGDRLGDHLVRSGKITREQLRQAIETLTMDPAHTLADVLLSAGSISRGELDRYVQHQVEEAVYTMCSWTKGQFRFTPGSPTPRHAVLVSLHAERLLLEAGRRADEWTVIEIAIPSFDRVYRRVALKPGASMPELTSEQHRILPLLDGTRNVNGIVDLSGLSAFEVGRALLDLITTQQVQLQDRISGQRHFDDTELHAYALKMAEFADPERRKDAARHIADCPLCGRRLRDLNARRTTDAPAKPTPAAPPPAIAPKRPTVAKPAPPATPPDRKDRRSSELVWLMSPEEADEVRRSEHRLTQPALPPQPPAPKPAAATPPPPPPPVTARPSEAKPIPAAANVTAPRPKLNAPKPPPARPRVSASQPAPVVPKRKVPVRTLAVAGTVVLLGGFIAWRATVARSAARPPVARPTQVAVAPPIVVTPPPVVDTATSAVVRTPDTSKPVVVRAPDPRPLTPDTAKAVRPPRDTTPPAPVVTAPPDAELSAWRVISRADAIAALGGRLGTIPNLQIESFATSEARGRTRVRVAQLARTGQRIVLIETAGADQSDNAATRASAVSVMAAPEPGGEAIGSASLGSLQITARSTLDAGTLQGLLGRLRVLR